jgi:hypothetical protein
MKYAYCQRPAAKVHWQIPEGMPGRRILVAIWRWM